MSWGRQAGEVAAERLCEVCGAPARPLFYLAGRFVLRCSGCGLYRLVPPARGPAESMLDTAQVVPALSALRAANFAAILDRLEELNGGRGRLLDVGCGSGQFVAAARERGWEAFGIDPEEAPFWPAGAPALGWIVRGRFPADVPPDWREFDVVCFNDVFEHLERPIEVLANSRERLRDGGLVSLALPSARGFAFRVARVLYQLGVGSPLERLFQVNYPYPHIYYFDPRSLTVLAERAGMAIVRWDRLRTFCRRGALARARMDRALDRSNLLKRYIVASALWALAVLDPVLPADSVFVVLRVRENAR